MNDQEFQEHVVHKLEELDKRLFKDNGSLSLQSKINKNTRDLKLITGLFTFLGTCILGLITFFIKKQIGE